MISLIVPAHNAQATLGKALTALTRAAIEGLVREVIVVDAGSDDATLAIADDCGADIVETTGDRGSLLGAGAAKARSPWIMTLSQDAQLLAGWEVVATRHLEAAPAKAGWFFLKAPGLMTRLSGRPVDGAALLVPRGLYDRRGGFGPGRAEATLGRAIGRGNRVRLAAPVLLG